MGCPQGGIVMKHSHIFVLLVLLVAAINLNASAQVQEPIYDENADAHALVAQALDRAKADNKRVLIQWGGNWCGWCYKLHDLLKQDEAIAKILSYEYELVMVDSRSNEALAKSLKTHVLVVPFLTVLAADGEKLVDRSAGLLKVGGRHDPAKVLAFLEERKAAPLDANALFEEAMAEADAEDKLVFVHFGTPWCGWCRRLESFLGQSEVTSLMSRRYVMLKIDQERMLNGAALRKRLYETGRGGSPWYAIVDAQGEVLVTSTGARGNIGFPVKARERAHFMHMIAQTAGPITGSDLARIRTLLVKSSGE